MSGLAGGETALEQMKVSLLRVDNPGVKGSGLLDCCSDQFP